MAILEHQDTSLASFQDRTSVETDITSWSIFTISASSGSTVPGPGSLTGKAILALGKATIRGAEYLIIRRRLRFISSKFPHKNITNLKGLENMYLDLLELSRMDMYPETIRLQAMRLLLVQIGSRETRHLMKTLKKWPSVELQILISELTSVLDPIRLTSLSEGVSDGFLNAYRLSFRSWEAHHLLTPFVDFLCQVSQLRPSAMEAVLQGNALDFLLHAYVTGFRDPNSITDWLDFDLTAAFRISCHHLLQLLSASASGLELILQHPIHALWLTRPDLPFTSRSECREKDRMEAWRSCKKEIILCRLHSTSLMMKQYETISQENATYDVCVDLLELAGSEDMDLQISMQAMRNLHSLTTRHHFHFQRGILRYHELSTPAHFVDLMTRIIRRLFRISLSVSPEADLFLRPSESSDVGVLAMLNIIRDLIRVAKVDNTFLEVLLAAKILNLLWDLLELEFAEVDTDPDNSKTTVPSKVSLLLEIGERGLAPLLPVRRGAIPLSKYRRRILCKAFDVFLPRNNLVGVFNPASNVVEARRAEILALMS